MTLTDSYWRLIPFAIALLCAAAPIMQSRASAATIASPARAGAPKCDSALSRLMVVAEVLRPLDNSANLSAQDANTFVDLAEKFLKVGLIGVKGQALGRLQCSMDLSISEVALDALRHSGTAQTYAAFHGSAFNSVSIHTQFETGIAKGAPFVNVTSANPREAISQIGWQWQAYRIMARSH